jgi:RNA polymerase sigma-70 factor (ECF subfamily)
MAEAKPDSTHTRALLDRLDGGDPDALNELLQRSRQPLRDFVELRLDPHLLPRLSASDVVQEAHKEVVRRIDDYLHRRPMPFHLWLRKTAYERLVDAHRTHHAECRTVAREAPVPDHSSQARPRSVVAKGPSPSQEAQARELADRVARAVAGLSEADSAVLLMRHGVDLPYEEIARVLDIEPAAARQRYGRALLRLQRVLTEEGLVEE